MNRFFTILVILILALCPAFVTALDSGKSEVMEYACLNISSNPINADIYINDSLIGKTPLPSIKISPGEYSIVSKIKDTPDVEIELSLRGGASEKILFVHNNSGENRSWAARHTLLLGSIVGFGILCIAFAVVASWASGLN